MLTWDFARSQPSEQTFIQLRWFPCVIRWVEMRRDSFNKRMPCARLCDSKVDGSVNESANKCDDDMFSVSIHCRLCSGFQLIRSGARMLFNTADFHSSGAGMHSQLCRRFDWKCLQNWSSNPFKEHQTIFSLCYCCWSTLIVVAVASSFGCSEPML